VLLQLEISYNFQDKQEADFCSTQYNRQSISQPVSQVVKQCGFRSFLQDFIRDMVQKGVVKLQHISTDEQIANILTKPLSRAKFVYFRDKLGMMQNVSLDEREC
jgi:hypothetical protein